MATPIWMNDGTDADPGSGTNHFFTATTSAVVTFDNTFAHTGSSSIKHASGAGNTAGTTSQASVLADAGRRTTQWVYFDGLPTADANILAPADSTNATTIFRLQLRTSGLLRFVGNANGADGAVTVPINQWVRISIAYTITSTGTNEFRAYVNGILAATATNLVLAATGSSRYTFGWSTAPGANKTAWWDDIYIDNGSDLSDVGDIRVTDKEPVAINVNTFDTTVGAGSIADRPILTTSNRTQAGTGTATCNFTIQDRAVGDVNISSFQIVGYMGWIWAAKGSGGGSPTDKITVNGVDTTVALATSAGLFTSVVSGDPYPANAAAIGMNRTVGAAADCNFFEGGWMVAYLHGLEPEMLGCPSGMPGQSQMQQLLAQ